MTPFEKPSQGARDVIAKAMQQRNYNDKWVQEDAQAVLSALISAPDSVRQELCPWREIDTAPILRPCLVWIDGGPDAVPGVLSSDRIWYINGRRLSGCKPTHWLPLPAPPSEDKA